MKPHVYVHLSRQTDTVTQSRTECSVKFPIAAAMFLSVVGSDSKCARWQNYTQAFSTLFSEAVTGQRSGRGLFVSADHTVPLPFHWFSCRSTNKLCFFLSSFFFFWGGGFRRQYQLYHVNGRSQCLNYWVEKCLPNSHLIIIKLYSLKIGWILLICVIYLLYL